MEPSRWDRVQELFHGVVDLPLDQQQGALDELGAEHAELRQEVLDLLREDAGYRGLLDGDLGSLAGSALQSDVVRSLVQQQIGPYRLLRLLGEGGMGVVYLAERTDIGGMVAIKLLRDAWISPMRRERFQAEQRTLARLNHRGIAHIYDAGTLTDGTPWFVMEFADGLPITEYLSQHQASAVATLELFRMVCEAIQHAHGLAIIHRDLKPSNIFVNQAGDVKLLDFGIAKNLDEQAADGRQTIAGLRLMSPAYAAPEQRSGDTVGVFTDVYALGILLFELLTGELPFGPGATPDTPPVKPSLKARAFLPRVNWALDRHEWADLDLICLTAMQPDPERRYRSADALARDIDAYLESRPLQGRRNASLYTAGKFIRRNRVALLSAACVLLIFTVTAVVFTVRLAAARSAALAETARVDRILDFTEELFDGGDPEAGPDSRLKVMDVLDRGRQEALGFSGDPRIRARLLIVLGTAYGKLGQIDTANQLLEKASTEAKGRPGEEVDYVNSLAALADLRRQQRKLPEALQLLKQALSAGEHLANGNELLERLHAELGSVLSLGGEYPAAERELQSALRLRSPAAAANAQLAEDLTQLAEVDHYLGRYDAAQALNQKALAINTSLHGRNHPTVAENLNNLAAIAEFHADHGRAEALLREALAITENWYGQQHPKTADALSALSSPLIAGSRLDEATAVLTRALAIEIHTYGEQHASVALVYNQLGLLASSRNKYFEAEKDFGSALAVWQKLYGPQHQFVGLAYSNLASVYMKIKDYPQAEVLCRQAVAVFSTALSGQNVNSAVAHLRLGRALLREGKLQEAETETLTGYRYFAAGTSGSDSYLAVARQDLAEIEAGLNRTDAGATRAVPASFR